MKKHLSILMVVLMVISAFSLPMNVEAVENILSQLILPLLTLPSFLSLLATTALPKLRLLA